MKSITAGDLGWILLAWLLGASLLCAVWNWLVNRYEIAGERLARRWYGRGAYVRLRSGGAGEGPALYRVLAWDDEEPVPWLKVTDDEDEDTDAFWASVTDFAPGMLRHLRPHLARHFTVRGRAVLLPSLFVYLPLSGVTP